MITNAFRQQSGETAHKETDTEQSAQLGNLAQMERQILSRNESRHTNIAGSLTGFERLSPLQSSPIQTTRSPILRSPILGQSLLHSSLNVLPVSAPSLLNSNLFGDMPTHNTTVSNLTAQRPERKNGMPSCLDFNFNHIEGNYGSINQSNQSNVNNQRPNPTTNRFVCAICNKKFRNLLQLQFHVKKVSYYLLFLCFIR